MNESGMSLEHPFPGVAGNGLTRKVVAALFPLFEEASAGAIAVDRDARITWINQSYAQVLGIPDPASVIGKPINDVISSTRMHEVVHSGRPILLDIMDVRGLHLVVTRLPVHDDEGNITGAVAFVLYDDLQPLTPLISKYRRLQQELSAARRALARRSTRYDLADFVGTSECVLEVKRRARLAGARNTPVLLLGETGTGKEVLAQAIHASSPRAEGPFVGVNVAAVPENLLEAEFFGVAPGAYTGADKRTREGKFQLADGGTLFLDEVGDMPLPMQAKILRVLQEREVEPLGSNMVHPVDVRVVAATSRDLERMVAEGSFRSDLYYRLNVLPIRVPPLRERLEDLLLLCDAILSDMTGDSEPVQVTPDGLAMLARHDWPGNIRELRNVLEQALTLNETSNMLGEDELRTVLPESSHSSESTSQPVAQLHQVRPLSAALAHAERNAISAALHAANGNRSQAARLLGISRSVLYEKLAKLSRTADTCADFDTVSAQTRRHLS